MIVKVTTLTPGALGERAAFLLAEVAPFLPEPVYLVGGAVRDALLGRAVHDLDLALPHDSLETARRLADRLGGAFVPLHEQHRVARVVLRWEDQEYRVDLADFRADGIEGDLRDRDFTINALAVAVAPLIGGETPILDPTGGLGDLAARRLRVASLAAFEADPLRTLRAVRLAHGLGLGVEPETAALAATAAPALAAVAGERVREELFRLLALPTGGAALRLADAWGLLDVILPETRAMKATPQPFPHRFTVWEHSLRAVEALERLLGDLGLLAPHDAAIALHLDEGVEAGVRRRELLKLAALLHDVAKPETRSEEGGRVRFIGHDKIGAERARAIAGRLRLGGRATRILERLVAQHLRLMHLGQLEEVSRRARYRFYRDLGEEAQDLICLAIADAAGATGVEPSAVWRGPAGTFLASFLAGQEEAETAAAAPPLLRGEDVMAAFDLAPGPEVGRLLAETREAQALGLVRSREEALAYLRARHLPGSGLTPPEPPDIE